VQKIEALETKAFHAEVGLTDNCVTVAAIFIIRHKR